LAVLVTKSVGTMWAAYVFTLIALVGAVALLTSNPFLILLVALISQTFLQLVLLPIIIVGQNVISASQDARAEADHLTLTTLHAINVQQLEMLEQQKEMLQQQREILDLIQKKRLAVFGPIALLTLFGVWGFAIIVAYSLMLDSIRDEFRPPVNDYLTSFYVSGTTLVPLAYGDFVPEIGLARALIFLESATGVGVA